MQKHHFGRAYTLFNNATLALCQNYCNACVTSCAQVKESRSVVSKMRLILLSLLFSWVFVPNVKTICFDKPQIFLHEKGSTRPLAGGDNNSSDVVFTDINRQFLVCTASQNVEWAYEGNGEPSKVQESTSIKINSDAEDGSIEYCVTSKLSIFPKQSDTDLAKHTGLYTCREIGNMSQSSSVHVFVGRRNAPAFLHSRKTITLTLGQENGTDSTFIIPCATSTPFVNATLFKRSPNSKFEIVPMKEGVVDMTDNDNDNSTFSTVNFAPRYGFRVGIPPGGNVASFTGEYKCVAKITSKLARNNENDFVIYNFVPTLPLRVYPPTQYVYTSDMLNLTCEYGEEAVILKEVKVRPQFDQYSYNEENESGEEDDDNPRSNSVEDVEEIVEKNEDKVHVANYLEMSPVPGSYGEFQCLTEKDKRVLHSWKYRILSRKEEKFTGIKFNTREGSFSCRSKSGLPAKLSFISCRTPSECNINGICLQRSESCRGYSNATKALCHRGNNFCGKIFYKGGSGLIRCVGEGIDQTRGFTDEANDQRLRMGFHKLKPSETAFLSLSNEGEKQKDGLMEGDEIDLQLRLGYYYFLQPVQWALKFKNGSSLRLEPSSERLETTKLYRTIHARIQLPKTTSSRRIDGSQTVSINALLPLRGSVPPSWKTITLPVRVLPGNDGGNVEETIIEETEGSGRSGLEGEEDEIETTTETLHHHDDALAKVEQSSPSELNSFNQYTEETETATSINKLAFSEPQEDAEGAEIIYEAVTVPVSSNNPDDGQHGQHSAITTEATSP